MNSNKGLYDKSFESDACGIGCIANIDGIKTNQIIFDSLEILENMSHRGATGNNIKIGDGAGIKTQIPHKLLIKEVSKKNIVLPAPGKYALGMFFFPNNIKEYKLSSDLLLNTLKKFGFLIIYKRVVPTNNKDLCPSTYNFIPIIEQWVIKPNDYFKSEGDFNRRLFIARKYYENLIVNHENKSLINSVYIVSLSTNIVIYKGQLTSKQVRDFYLDLSNISFESCFAIVHSRFSTNTFPSWKLAQPFRYISHNGEINTLKGNLNSLKSAESRFESSLFSKEELNIIRPLVFEDQSDSACLDNLIELLSLSDKNLDEIIMTLIPEAWDKNDNMSNELKSFYEFKSNIIEPWDGPAAIIYTNGKRIGSVLDRNGLRPMRYTITKDNKIVIASEAGVLHIDPENIKEKGNLRSGKILSIDFENNKVRYNGEIKGPISKASPYSNWLKKNRITLDKLPKNKLKFKKINNLNLEKYHKVFGYTKEDIEKVIYPMSNEGGEPIGSMGNDSPIAVLSKKSKHLSNYFKQLFAQVTNPPIDPIRERNVMSLNTHLGNFSNLLFEKELDCQNIFLESPIISNDTLEKIRSIDFHNLQSKTINAYYKVELNPGNLKKALDRLCRYVDDAIEDGYKLIIISDRYIDSSHAPIPSLLSCSCIHNHLIRSGKRGYVGLIAESGDSWEVHHFATLLSFGVNAINPYITLATIRQLRESNSSSKLKNLKTLRNNYINAINNGLLKVFSKIGISTLKSYQGSQLFEIIGLNNKIVDQYFTSTTSRIEGMGINEIEIENNIKHAHAFDKEKSGLSVGGIYSWKKEGEEHSFNPKTISLLQHSTLKNDFNLFKQYSSEVNNINKTSIRSYLEFNFINDPIPLSQVEPPEEIYKRFATGAMSFGSISYEAHSNLAIAMNKLGGRSNSGEGGEDENRFTLDKDGNNLNSAIKQVASGRFGVTINYLNNAKEIQIKMAQGAKPGEGGQLPGHKVDKWIAKVRNSTPGVGLISPPPHHDIYSIEDLSQLIFDLKNTNRDADISVKLVSKAGVGTIAAGVVKAKSDKILISGYDGGTGASPLSSVQHAGLPWELGLSETQQVLMKNGLRSRVKIQVDGQIKTGRDLVIASILGADEWGLSSAALISQGCIMMRKCHLNTCPVGIATQDKVLRKRFNGEVDHMINLIKFLTEELREIMASLGIKKVDDLIGQTNLLKQKKNNHYKIKGLDLYPILYKYSDISLNYFNSSKQKNFLSDQIDYDLLKESKKSIINPYKKTRIITKIKNTDRAVGTILSSEITKKYGSKGLPKDSIKIEFNGSAGQSFGAFACKGLTLKVNGEANDYFGKGLSGANLIIKTPEDSDMVSNENNIVGNVALYGATSGQCFINGIAGERFCVRNSGADVIVEGVGDNACEYMTGGNVIIIGNIGKNFGAGMSGGIAYVFGNRFPNNYNKSSIDLVDIEKRDHKIIKRLLRSHKKFTNSYLASYILDDFDNQFMGFTKVYPKELKVIENKNKTKINA